MNKKKSKLITFKLNNLIHCNYKNLLSSINLKKK